MDEKVIRIYQYDQILQDKRLPVGTSALLKLEGSTLKCCVFFFITVQFFALKYLV